MWLDLCSSRIRRLNALLSEFSGGEHPYIQGGIA
jgi:hypothetical protein